MFRHVCVFNSQGWPHIRILPYSIITIYINIYTALNEKWCIRMSFEIEIIDLICINTSSNRWKDSALRWRHNERDGVSNHQPHDCLLNRLFRPRSKKTSKLRVTGLCAGNSPGTGEFPAQMASNAEMSPFDDVIMVHREGLLEYWASAAVFIVIWFSMHIIMSHITSKMRLNIWFMSLRRIVAIAVPSHYQTQCWYFDNWTTRNLF